MGKRSKRSNSEDGEREGKKKGVNRPQRKEMEK